MFEHGPGTGDAEPDAAPEGQPARRLPLSRARIVATSVRYVDRLGEAALTMRRLGRELGVEAMSLYRYVRNRDDLLDAVVDHHHAAVARRLDAGGGSALAWDDYLVAVAVAVRDQALAHPESYRLVLTRPVRGLGLCPPLGAAVVADPLVAHLRAAGLSEERATYVYCALSAFLSGRLMLELPLGAGADAGGPVEDADEVPSWRALAEASTRGSDAAATYREWVEEFAATMRLVAAPG